MAQVFFQIDNAAVRAVLTNPRGDIAQDLLRRGRNVANLAKKFAPVNTGRLRESINAELVSYAGNLAVLVGTKVSYAMYQHEGTGIYGPHGTPIVPVRSKFLRFQPKGSLNFVYAREVRGAPPTFFLKRALVAAAK